MPPPAAAASSSSVIPPSIAALSASQFQNRTYSYSSSSRTRPATSPLASPSGTVAWSTTRSSSSPYCSSFSSSTASIASTSSYPPKSGPPPPLPVSDAIANFRPTSRQVISAIAPHVFDERPRRKRSTSSIATRTSVVSRSPSGRSSSTSPSARNNYYRGGSSGSNNGHSSPGYYIGGAGTKSSGNSASGTGRDGSSSANSPSTSTASTTTSTPKSTPTKSSTSTSKTGDTASGTGSGNGRGSKSTPPGVPTKLGTNAATAKTITPATSHSAAAAVNNIAEARMDMMSMSMRGPGGQTHFHTYHYGGPMLGRHVKSRSAMSTITKSSPLRMAAVISFDEASLCDDSDELTKDAADAEAKGKILGENDRLGLDDEKKQHHLDLTSSPPFSNALNQDGTANSASITTRPTRKSPWQKLRWTTLK
ncbi:hypothetical protein BDN72DRAFT_895393 [Pluteus cervinus]|uniref:Uncharacterized protein n=1 Tax=Pluteus cervinus TaxID=181527 RepID=A0ACD3B0Y8_9AGAR|nr:hypothetical protein BDN72DRAFT_895393 [Pluteus cervinus]